MEAINIVFITNIILLESGKRDKESGNKKRSSAFGEVLDDLLNQWIADDVVPVEFQEGYAVDAL